MEERERPAPAGRRPNWGAIFFVVLVLGAAGFGVWFCLRPPPPDAVVQRFLDAAKAGDFDEVKACLVRSDIRQLETTLGGEAAAKQALRENASKLGGKITGVTYDPKDSSLAYVAVEPYDKTRWPSGIASIEIICAKEDGQWKVDLIGTATRLMVSGM